MAGDEIAAVLHALQRRYRLILDSAGSFNLYVEIPSGDRPVEWVRRFWEEHARLQAEGRQWEEVPRPFDPDAVVFLTPE